MYRVILRDDVIESDVQPYREIDVRILLLEPKQVGTEEHEGTDTDAPDTEEVEECGFPLNPISPLLLLTAAQDEAAEILTQARTEAETLKQAAYEQGLTLGRQEGKGEVKKELLASLTAFAQAQQSLVTIEEQLVSHFTPEIVRLALAIGEKIVGVRIAEDATITASVLERARAEVSQAQCVNIWLHPADYEVLVECRPDLVKASAEGGRQVAVFTAETVGRGGCRVETEMGVVEATIPVQMEEIRKKLFNEG